MLQHPLCIVQEYTTLKRFQNNTKCLCWAHCLPVDLWGPSGRKLVPQQTPGRVVSLRRPLSLLGCSSVCDGCSHVSSPDTWSCVFIIQSWGEFYIMIVYLHMYAMHVSKHLRKPNTHQDIWPVYDSYVGKYTCKSWLCGYLSNI